MSAPVLSFLHGYGIAVDVDFRDGRVEQFQTQDGVTLTETRVQALVDAMATFTPPDIGTTELPDDYNELLQIVGINWTEHNWTESDFSII